MTKEFTKFLLYGICQILQFIPNLLKQIPKDGTIPFTQCDIKDEEKGMLMDAQPIKVSDEEEEVQV